MAIQIDVLCVEEGYPDLSRTEVYDKDLILIGRSDANDLILDHPGISSNHVQLRVDKNGGAPHFYLTDLRSTNGTFVGSKLAPADEEIMLGDRDRVMIAGYILRMQYVADESRPPGAKEAAKKVVSIDPFSTTNVKNTSSFIRPEVDLSDDAELFSAVPSQPENRPDTAPVAPEMAARVSLEADDVELDFVATQLLSLSGTVTHKGMPLAGVAVADAELGTHTTDSSGRFSFDAVLDGTIYRLTFSKQGYVFTSDCSGTVDGSDEVVSITAKRLGKIRGSVIHKGTPLAGVVIDGGTLGQVVTDASGAYEFSNVLEGEEYTLKASKDGFAFGTIKKRSE